MRLPIIILAILGIGFTGSAQGQVTEYTSAGQWEQVVGEWTSVGFAEYPSGTIVTTQYQDLGVTFTGSSDVVTHGPFYLQDGGGIYGGFDDLIIMEFSTPQYYFAVDFPGGIQISLFSQDSLLFSGTPYDLSGAGLFAGVVSTKPFDRVVLDEPDVDIFIDDIRFGVPAPGVLMPLAIAILSHRKRRS